VFDAIEIDPFTYHNTFVVPIICKCTIQIIEFLYHSFLVPFVFVRSICVCVCVCTRMGGKKNETILNRTDPNRHVIHWQEIKRRR